MRREYKHNVVVLGEKAHAVVGREEHTSSDGSKERVNLLFVCLFFPKSVSFVSSFVCLSLKGARDWERRR